MSARRARFVEVEGVVYTVTPLAQRRLALSCEPPLGVPLPAYATRVALRARLPARAVVLFTDAARSAEVWWEDGRERIRWPGEPEAPRAREKRANRGCPAIPAKVLEMMKLPDGGEPFAALHAALADPAGPGVVRAVWRSVLSLRVLDPAAGTGDWLVEAMEALEQLYAECLQQMTVWVGEVALGRDRKRPEYLRDFRHAFARAGLTRETILLRNLYGVAESERAAAACRARLHRRLPRGSPLPLACIRVRAGDPAYGFAGRPALARALVGLPDAPRMLRELSEEVEALRRADRLASVADRSGLLALEARRAALRRGLDALAFRSTGGDPGDPRALRRWLAGHRPLHPYLEWPDRFHLVRGEGA